MIKSIRRLVLVVTILVACSSWASSQIKVIKLSVTNPTNDSRAAENVVINVADLRRIAPDFKPAAVIITTSNAATLDEDARTLQTVELPSQADDLDGDFKIDELAFQIELKPKQTRIVSVSYGDQATIARYAACTRNVPTRNLRSVLKESVGSRTLPRGGSTSISVMR